MTSISLSGEACAHALDITDYNRTELSIEVVHRPATDTPLKNKADGERHVALDESTCAVLDDWVAEQRLSVTDENGREPLLASVHGRPRQHLRKLVYAWTRPCAVSDDCPHGRPIDDCDAAGNTQEYSCPSSVPPHAIRRGAITHWLTSEWPSAVSGRAIVSQDVLETRYDQRSEQEKMEQRRRYLNTL